MKLAIIIAEYGRPAPDVTQYRECWPDADIQVYAGNDLPETRELDPAHPRYGWRMNDYWKVRMMLDSGADVAMCFDGDMRIVNREAARMLPVLAERFGLCLPINPRYTVGVDARDGADTRNFGLLAPDAAWANTPGFNCSPIALRLAHGKAFMAAQEYCRVMLKIPMRGPLAWSLATWRERYAPLILPPQWCVCERHIGVGDEIILHEGHEAVKRHYARMVTK